MQAQNKSVIIATQNKGKAKEFAAWFEPLGIEISSLADYDELPAIVENGATFAENALIKARTIANYLHVPVLADDSGLMVDALDGRPGIYSARFAGLQATDEENNSKLISELAGLNPLADIAEAELALAPFTVEEAPQEPPQMLSRARFVCALAYIDPVQNRVVEAEGVCEGYIIREPRGDQASATTLIFLPAALPQNDGRAACRDQKPDQHRLWRCSSFFAAVWRGAGMSICAQMQEPGHKLETPKLN